LSVVALWASLSKIESETGYDGYDSDEKPATYLKTGDELLFAVLLDLLVRHPAPHQ
jgi:hypothetical protein